MKWKLIVDSGCDLRTMDQLAPDTEFVSVPLMIHVGETAFLDTSDLNIDEMMDTMYAFNGKTSSSCPSPEAYLTAYNDADNIIVITLTGTLSGSNNSAELAKKMLLEEQPNKNIHIIDSLSAGGEMVLLAQYANQLITDGHSFEEVVSKLTDYTKHTRLIFILANVDNLVKNGRLNKIVGKMIGMLNMRLIGLASTQGTLEVLHKVRGQKKAVTATVAEMIKQGYNGGRVMISHMNNEDIGIQIRNALHEHYPQADVQFIPTSGLCSYYAEKEGILMGFEVE